MTIDWMAEARQRFNALKPAEQKKYEKAWDAAKAAVAKAEHDEDAAKERFWQALANGHSAVECKALASHFDAVTTPPTAEPETPEPPKALPHGALTLLGRKVQTNRHLKCECPECHGIVRATRKYLTTTGAPLCACTGVDTPTRMSNPLTDGDDIGDDGDD